MEYYKNLSLEDIKYFCEYDFKWKTEQWKDISDYEGHYLISDLGRVKSLKLNTFKIIKTFVNDNGYIHLRLCKNGICKTRKVHQLVSESFLGHIVNGFELVVNHKNFNRKDNRSINLEIVTTRENTSLRKIKYSSRFTGVTWCKNKDKWLSRIYFNGKRYNLGAFDNEEEASLYYENALKDLNLGNKVVKKPFVKKFKGIKGTDKAQKVDDVADLLK